MTIETDFSGSTGLCLPYDSLCVDTQAAVNSLKDSMEKLTTYQNR